MQSRPRLRPSTAAAILTLVAATPAMAQNPSGAAPSPSPAAAPPEQRADCGVLLMAHGGDELWNRAVETVAAPLRDAYPVEIAFGMAQTSTLRDATERLERQGVQCIAVVRMFISPESFLEETEYILGLRDTLPSAAHSGREHRGHAAAPQPAHGQHATGHDRGHAPQHGATGTSGAGGHSMEPPVAIDTDAEFFLSREGVSASALVDEILIDRVRSLSLDPARECVLILAHGPGDDEENQRWLAEMNRRAAGLAEIGPFQDARCETLREDWPERRAESERRIRDYVREQTEQGTRVVVVPFRVAGFGPYADVLGGLEYVADGRGFCPHPHMTRWIDERARECLPELPPLPLREAAAAPQD